MDRKERVGLLASMFWLAPSALAGAGISDGLWKFDISYELTGIPQHYPEYSTQRCLSEADPLPVIARPGQECVDTLQGRYGQTVTWQLNCSSGWEMVQGMGRIHFEGNRANGDVYLQTANPYNPPQSITFFVKGKRIGEC